MQKCWQFYKLRAFVAILPKFWQLNPKFYAFGEQTSLFSTFALKGNPVGIWPGRFGLDFARPSAYRVTFERNAQKN